MRAAVYARLSALQTDEVRDSVPQQLRDGHAAVERAGWDLVGEYADRSVSAWDGGPGGHGRARDRPAWDEILRLARAGEADVVVARHVDRLLRNPRARADLRASGLRVADHSGNVLDDFALGILAEVATKESDVRSDRQRRAEERRVEAGRPPRGGRRHYGYDRDHGVVPEEAAVIREAAARWLAGEAMTALARELNERGVPTSGGGRWTRTSLRKLLLSPRLAAIRVHRGEEVAGDWEPILDRELHLRLVEADGSSGARRSAPERYLLTGLLDCGRCGASLNGKRHAQTPGGRRYACLACHRNGIAAGPVEAHLWNEALARAWSRDRDAAGRLEGRIEAAEARRAEVASALTELEDAYWVERSVPKETYSRVAARLRGERDGLEVDLRDLRRERDAERGYWANLLRLAETFEEATAEERRRVLERTVARVTLRPAGRAGGRVDLGRLEVEWRA